MTCPHCHAPTTDDSRFCGVCGKATASTEKVAPPGTAVRAAAEPNISGKEIAGRYRIHQKIGEGGMGAVFKGEQISLKRQVAIKLLRPDVSSNAMLSRRFEAEAAAVAKLSHPNTVNIYDHGHDADGTLFIVMEFVEGRSLRSVVQGEAPLSVRRTLAIAAQIAASLTDAHAHGIIHRDLKPDNVMLQDRGRQKDVVRVLDFGIAKLRDDSRATQMAMTQAGDMLGTPQYMSPEQIKADTVDGRTDVYALGCMMYEMLTARLPFEAPTVMALLSKHLMENPPPPSMRRPDLGIPHQIDHLIMRAMAKEVHIRPATMELFGEEIAATLAQLPPDAAAGTAQRSAVVGVPPISPTMPVSPTPNWAPSTPPPGAPTPTPQHFGGQVHAPTPLPHAQPPQPPPAYPTPQAGPKKSSNAALWAIVAVIVLAGGGLGIYFATKKKDDPSAKKDPDKPDPDKPDPDKPDPDESLDDVVEKFIDYKNQMCACDDVDCGHKLNVKFEAWGKRVKDKHDVAKLAKKLKKAAYEYDACYTKLKTGVAPDDDDSGGHAKSDPWKPDPVKPPPVAQKLPGTVVDGGGNVKLNVPPGFTHQANAGGVIAMNMQSGVMIAVAPGSTTGTAQQMAQAYATSTGLKLQGTASTVKVNGIDRPAALFAGSLPGVGEVSHVVVLFAGAGYGAVVVFHIPAALVNDSATRQLGDEVLEKRIILPRS